jgi:hypothetical protein
MVHPAKGYALQFKHAEPKVIHDIARVKRRWPGFAWWNARSLTIPGSIRVFHDDDLIV